MTKPQSRRQLLERIEELEGENDALNDKLDSIIELARDADVEEDDED
ncbi:MAG: hypothetical protein ABI972_05585 [Acidobacteriota bacterium]